MAAHAALSAGRLRHLARLHRSGVEGASSELAAVAQTRADELAALLGTAPDACEGVDSVEALVRAIESAPGRARRAMQRRARLRAETLADRLGRGAVLRGDSTVDLDVEALAELLACGGYRHIGVLAGGDVRLVPRSRLRAAIRACAGCRIDELSIGPSYLLIVYRTSNGHGCLRFVAQTMSRHDEDVVVVRPKSARDRTPREPPVTTTPPSTRTRKEPDFLDHIVAALREAVS